MSIGNVVFRRNMVQRVFLHSLPGVVADVNVVDQPGVDFRAELDCIDDDDEEPVSFYQGNGAGRGEFWEDSADGVGYCQEMAHEEVVRRFVDWMGGAKKDC